MRLLDKTFHLVLITITVIISHLYKLQIETLEKLTDLTNLHGHWVEEGALESKAEFQAYFFSVQRFKFISYLYNKLPIVLIKNY